MCEVDVGWWFARFLWISPNITQISQRWTQNFLSIKFICFHKFLKLRQSWRTWNLEWSFSCVMSSCQCWQTMVMSHVFKSCIGALVIFLGHWRKFVPHFCPSDTYCKSIPISLLVHKLIGALFAIWHETCNTKKTGQET